MSAEVQESSKKGKGSKQKKMTVRVDFTPMVDMNMLLITFFMLCTTLSKPQTMEISMPSNDKNITEEQQSKVKASQAITLLLAGGDKLSHRSTASTFRCRDASSRAVSSRGACLPVRSFRTWFSATAISRTPTCWGAVSTAYGSPTANFRERISPKPRSTTCCSNVARASSPISPFRGCARCVLRAVRCMAPLSGTAVSNVSSLRSAT